MRSQKPRTLSRQRVAAALVLLIAAVDTGTALAALPAATEDALKTSQYVYIASTRKDGSLSTPAEIWFFYHAGSVYVGTPASSWRARRIKWGRPQAKIWVGKRDGPSFMATGQIVTDAATQEMLLKTFSEKYASSGWSTHGDRFRSGFKDGSRVLIKYTPVDDKK